MRKYFTLFKKPFQKIGILTISQAWAAGAAFATQIILARLLPVSDFGALMTAMATVMAFSTLVSFGVGSLWLRLFGELGWHATVWIKPSLLFTLFAAFAAMLSLLIFAKIGGQNEAVRILIYWLLAVAVLQGWMDLVYAACQLQEKFGRLALWQTVPHTSRLVVAVVAVILSLNANEIAQGYFFTALLICCILLFELRPMWRGTARITGHGSRDENAAPSEMAAPGLLEVISRSWPFALVNVFSLVIFYGSLIMLEWIEGPALAGLYSPAFVLITATYLVPGIIYQRFLMPYIHRWAVRDSSRYLQIYRFGNGMMGMLGLLVGIGTAVLAPFLILFLFGERYSESTHVLMILSISIPIRFLATNIGSVLLTKEYSRRRVWYDALGVVMCVAACAILIPAWGLYGAAAATVLTELALLACYLYGVRRYVFGSEAWRGWTARASILK